MTPTKHIKNLVRSLYRSYSKAGYPLLPLTRFAREPLRWYFHRSPLMRHDSRPFLRPYLVMKLHEALVRELPQDFKIYHGQIKFRSYGSLMSLHGYYVGEIEYHLLRFLQSQIRDGFVMLDVGGHHGLFTLTAAFELKRRGFSGKVYSFEPYPENFDLLRYNVQQNNLNDYTQLLNIAVAATPGTGDLVVRLDENSDNSLDTGTQGTSEHTVRRQVPITTLDQMMDQIKRVHVIKIDVQGGEPAVLAGAEQLIARDRPVLIVEAVPEWPSTAQIRDFLVKHDYKIYGVDSNGQLCLPNSNAAFVSWDWVGIPQ